MRAKLNMSLDGIVLTIPPKSAVDRENYCRGAATHMWRKPSEANSPELAGQSALPRQVPLARVVPMWGGVSVGGFSVVTFHKTRKMSADEWVNCVKKGKLRTALASINPQKPDGPWTVLCDGERFLHTRASNQAYRGAKVTLLTVPPRSPDLNPVEKFWSWLRRELVALDLKDLKNRRPALGKAAFKKRVRSLCHSQRAKAVARNVAKSWRKTCVAVVAARGAAVKG